MYQEIQPYLSEQKNLIEKLSKIQNPLDRTLPPPPIKGLLPGSQIVDHVL